MVHEPVWQHADDFLGEAKAWDYDSDLELDDPPAKRTYPFPEWHLKAACQDADERLFFGSPDANERPALSMTQIRQAKKICAACPVFETCLRTSFKLDGEHREEYGVWAGLSGRTRKRIFFLVDECGADIEAIAEDILDGQVTKYERDFEKLVPKSLLTFAEYFGDYDDEEAA